MQEQLNEQQQEALKYWLDRRPQLRAFNLGLVLMWLFMMGVVDWSISSDLLDQIRLKLFLPILVLHVPFLLFWIAMEQIAKRYPKI